MTNAFHKRKQVIRLSARACPRPRVAIVCSGLLAPVLTSIRDAILSFSSLSDGLSSVFQRRCSPSPATMAEYAYDAYDDNFQNNREIAVFLVEGRIL